MFRSNSASVTLVVAMAAFAFAGLYITPATARSGVFDRGGMHNNYGRTRFDRRGGQGSDSREGRVNAAQFLADGAQEALGSGEIGIFVLPESTPVERDRLGYEAAMLDRLGAAGYDISGNGRNAPQVAQIRILRNIAVPAERKRSPVSGETSVTVSNRGSSVGMALRLDFTKPEKALLSTLMELKIRDRVSDTVLWEGRAQIFTRDEDPDWNEDDIANRLAAALLEGFPIKGASAVR